MSTVTEVLLLFAKYADSCSGFFVTAFKRKRSQRCPTKDNGRWTTEVKGQIGKTRITWGRGEENTLPNWTVLLCSTLYSNTFFEGLWSLPVFEYLQVINTKHVYFSRLFMGFCQLVQTLKKYNTCISFYSSRQAKWMVILWVFHNLFKS